MMSYTLLIVDDEIPAIDGVKADLDLEKLNITELYTALNIRQAIGFFKENRVDILLCDIEMPQGSGLELLEWVRRHYPETVAIFLTSHSDFHYAKEAMRLGSLDYLLKPLLASELEETIQKAQTVIEHNSAVNRYSNSHQLWLKNQALVVERFWVDLINHTIPSQLFSIREQIELNHLPILEEATFQPLLVSIKSWNKPLSRRDEKIMEYALKKSSEEILLAENSGNVFFLESGKLLIIYSNVNEQDWDEGKIKKACSQYINFCNRFFYCELTCYLGKPVKVIEVAGLVLELKEQDKKNVAFYNKVYTSSGHEPYQDCNLIDIPDMNVWMSLLKSRKKEEVIKRIRSYLQELVQSQSINANILHLLREDYMQALYSFLNMKGIQAHKLFGDEESLSLLEKAPCSVKDMITWIEHVINKAVTQAIVFEETGEVIKMVRTYITNNLDHDLSRDTLANQVYLNPDHLSRIFKKETGYSLSEFVLLERIEHAKYLLTNTDISVSEIALSIGHSNFSHFTKIFKKYTGLGPSEYRLCVGMEEHSTISKK